MLVQYDELTIRAMRAMRYAAALTVQAVNCTIFGRSKKQHSSGCASLLLRLCWLDIRRGAYEPAIDRITRPRTAAERPPHECHQ